MGVHEPRVAAADFIRGFASWRLHAARQPVVVTHHGKDAHVLISLADYRRLDGADDAAGASALRDSQAALLESIRDGVILIDRQRRIAALNPAASDLLETPAARLIGADLTAALPGIEASLLYQHILRLIDHRERFSGEIPGLLAPQRWLRVDLVPLPLGGAIVFRDISGAMADFAAGDTRQATLDAIETAGGIGIARISVRETIDDANDALTRMIGVDATAIRRVRFSALLAIGERAAFADALEALLHSGNPARIASQLVTREGQAIAVTLALAALRGAYASEGAVVVVTR